MPGEPSAMDVLAKLARLETTVAMGQADIRAHIADIERTLVALEIRLRAIETDLATGKGAVVGVSFLAALLGALGGLLAGQLSRIWG